MTDSLPTFCTLAAWAERFGFSLSAAQRMARAKEIPAFKVGSRWFVSLDAVAADIKAQTRRSA